MGTDSMKNQLAALRAAWAQAPIVTRSMAGPYMDPLMSLLDAIVKRIEPEEKVCPHAAPFKFCLHCVTDPCPIGLGQKGGTHGR